MKVSTIISPILLLLTVSCTHAMSSDKHENMMSSEMHTKTMSPEMHEKMAEMHQNMAKCLREEDNKVCMEKMKSHHQKICEDDNKMCPMKSKMSAKQQSSDDQNHEKHHQ